MKRPNKFLEKKYISSLVIAAFLILSVLTAYNISTGKKTPGETNTKVEETIGNNDDVINSGNAENNDNAAAQEDNSETQGNEPDSTENDNGGRNSDSRTDTANNTSESGEENLRESGQAMSGDDFHYDGKTKLTWPVVGNILLPYSMDTTVYYTTLDQYACNEGVLIGAKKGQEVVAAADGRIVNIDKSDRWGQTITILIGNYYEISYGQVENIQYDVGDEVKEGDIIASVAEPTRAFTLEGPHLFLKMTCKGEPVNPTEYLES